MIEALGHRKLTYDLLFLFVYLFIQLFLLFFSISLFFPIFSFTQYFNLNLPHDLAPLPLPISTGQQQRLVDSKTL